LLREAHAERLQSLKINTDNSVAIGAAWEEARRTLPVIDPNQEFDLRKAVPVPGAARFLGFVEGRLKIPTPHWWAAELNKAHAYHRDHFLFFLNDAVKINGRGLPDEFGVVPSIKRDAKDGVLVEWDKHRLDFSADVIPHRRVDGFSAVVADGRCFIACYTPLWAGSYCLYCVEPTSQKIVWSTLVCSGAKIARSFSGGGSFDHNVALVAHQGAVFVFGMDANGAYIEGFKISDGTNLLRFATSHRALD